ncbi:hypothetical protein [Nocardioides massiliensis]|uniref:Uncharacterized protein n=1 Tax=Nocardioides massiliensis TaxID=1325935 RepID=A0ABT9NIY6_9ACTN|nr:hypothetical protein [Nocardioides massiliensis]MDP9820375.1 hypothetical protein [Nocardioides massiliensis]
MEWAGISSVAQLSTPAVLAVIALLVITDKLVWHTRLKRAEKRVEKLEEMLLSALGVAERTTVGAEVAHKVIEQLPDPGSGRGKRR